MTKTISFKTTTEEFDLIAKIADRAMPIAKRHGIPYSRQTCLMDLTATHANAFKLRLAELATAADADFTHDVFGIRRHLNRDTGTLGDCFVPRFADRQEPEVTDPRDDDEAIFDRAVARAMNPSLPE